MRACYLENLSEYGSTIELSTKAMHHLVNVVRLKVGDELKFFDRDQNISLVSTEEITKKNMIFRVLEKSKAQECKIKLSFAIGKLKKDAMDLAIKQLVEIGASKIIIFESTFSQAYPIKIERLEKIIISAMEQSNNFNFPEINFMKLDDLLKSEKNKIYFSSVTSEDQKIDAFNENSIFIIGPEGGMSENEEKILIESSDVINLPTFILRASTAVSYCAGYVSAKMQLNV